MELEEGYYIFKPAIDRSEWLELLKVLEEETDNLFWPDGKELTNPKIVDGEHFREATLVYGVRITKKEWSEDKLEFRTLTDYSWSETRAHNTMVGTTFDGREFFGFDGELDDNIHKFFLESKNLKKIILEEIDDFDWTKDIPIHRTKVMYEFNPPLSTREYKKVINSLIKANEDLSLSVLKMVRRQGKIKLQPVEMGFQTGSNTNLRVVLNILPLMICSIYKYHT